MLGMLTSTVGKATIILGLLVALGTMAATALHRHDAAVIASVGAAITKADLASERADHARTVTALETVASEAASRADAMSHTLENIANAIPSSECERSAPIGAALDGLRKRGAGGNPGAPPRHP